MTVLGNVFLAGSFQVELKKLRFELKLKLITNISYKMGEQTAKKRREGKKRGEHAEEKQRKGRRNKSRRSVAEKGDPEFYNVPKFHREYLNQIQGRGDDWKKSIARRKINQMTPQVTVFFHKLPATSTKRTGHRVSFVIGYAPAICAMSKPSLGGRQGKAAMKVVKTQVHKAPSKNAMRNQRKRAARAQRKKDAQAQTIEAILAEIAQCAPTPAEVTKDKEAHVTSLTTKTSLSAHFMVGTIPIYLPATESVMVTSTLEDETKSQSSHQLSQESTETSIEEEVDPKKIAEEIAESLQTPQKLPGRPKGSKNREYPVFRNDSYPGPITRTRAQKMSREVFESTSSVDGTSWNDNPLFEVPIGSEKWSDTLIAQVQQFQDSPQVLMSQLQDAKTSGSEDSGDAQVFVTSPSNPEEQMQELQRRINQIEREAAQRLSQFERETAQRQEIEAKMRADAEAEATRKLAEKKRK
ncbi:hypothetical protein M0R45_008946 [Rubus argutus]|uniref:Uncharacterized protein n=1 Tax=Rubus argutus TaxID=59490 RepID=A0AAW1Y260_RUBAR